MTPEPDRRRPQRALEILRELVRLKPLVDEVATASDYEQWRAAWRDARRLLAEEVPATEVRP
jgi:hypothetical protein